MLNFLRHSDRVWRLFAINQLDYTNRLRHSDYLRLLNEQGFVITIDDSLPDEHAMEQLRTLPLDARFENYSVADLATLTSYIVAKPLP
jgi:hypothetical protein